MPERIQLSRARGWKMPPNTVNVARPTKWGNLFLVDVYGLDLALLLYERSIKGFWTPDGIPDDLIEEAYRTHCELRSRVERECMDVHSLFGFDVACWCKPAAKCHGDILIRLANPTGAPPLRCDSADQGGERVAEALDTLLTPEQRHALRRAARYLSTDDSIDTREADRIAAVLRGMAH